MAVQYHQHKQPPSLRFDWTNLERRSELAQQIEQHQTNCTLPMANFRYRNRFGLGSDLHVYSLALCNALEAGSYRVRTVLPWIWLDDATCNKDTASAMTCYFSESELQCPNDRFLLESASSSSAGGGGQQLPFQNMTRGRGRIRDECPGLRNEHGVAAIRAATTEFLFTRVSAAVMREAERQLRVVFSDQAVPRNLITVHIRWGDKEDEMNLVPVSDYVSGVEQILQKRNELQHHKHDNDDDDGIVNIFLATEDPKAVIEFRNEAPSVWNIYVDQYFSEMLPYRRVQYNGSPLMSQDLKGKPGLIALGSLLIAMEANDFVLTTASNWSRLMNELRKNVLNPRCGNCTSMVDLKFGEM